MANLHVVRDGAPSPWQLPELAGHLTELSSTGAAAATTVAVRLVREAQAAGEPAAWIQDRAASFYPPDAVTHGVDLDALAVVRVPEAGAIGRAADYLVRSGAFGLVVLDLAATATLPDRQLTRLLGLARKHGTAIVCLTAKPDSAPSLGGLIALRVAARRRRVRPGAFACELSVLKDKRRAPGWRHEEACGGPPGLR